LFFFVFCSLACLRCRITAISTTFTQQTHTL
jgi:hypothetical protein